MYQQSYLKLIKVALFLLCRGEKTNNLHYFCNTDSKC